MKKVLFVTHRLSPFYHVIPKSLLNLGFKVDIFDYYQSNLKVRFIGYLNNLSKFDKNRSVINKEINLSLIDKVRETKPDYLLTTKALNIDKMTIKEIKKSGVVTINWFQDLLEFLPWLKEHGRVYDYLFTPDPLMVRELRRNKITVFYLPLAAQTDIKLKNIKKKYNVVFSGQYTLRREKLFAKLTSLGDKFIIWGYSDWGKSSLSAHYKGLLPSVECMLQKFRESKIVINVQTGGDKDPSEVVSLRAFEATGMGTFLLNWWHKPIDDFWEDGKEIVNFKSPEEALIKAKYFLSHEKEREKIAKAGWERTKKDHTFKLRFKKMFEIVS